MTKKYDILREKKPKKSRLRAHAKATHSLVTCYEATKHLRTPEEVEIYLDACFEESNGDVDFIAKALGNIALAQGKEADELVAKATIAIVNLFQHGGAKLVSRAQAKGIINRFEKSNVIILDFAGVEEIGQAFSDEVFRVFKETDPGTHLVPVRMTDAVKNMVARAKAGIEDKLCEHDWQRDGQTMTAIRWSCSKCGETKLSG